MKISSIELSEVYSHLAFTSKVYLNDELQDCAIFADDENGLIERYILKNNHDFIFDDNGNPITEVVKGNVRIELNVI